jgi:hypothetical protein
MSDTQRAILTALYAAVLGALTLPLAENTRRHLIGAARSLAHDLRVPCYLDSRDTLG